MSSYISDCYKESDLSESPLHWMVERATEAGLAFDEGVMKKHGVSPKPDGKIHDSMTLLYRVEGKHERPIGGDATQSVHSSATDRWDKVPDYRPNNLRDYFKRVGDSRGDKP